MGKIIKVASREVLTSRDAILGVAVFLNTLPTARRPTLDWLADVIFGFAEAGGIILAGEGYEIEIYDTIIDDAHGDDGSAKWVSDMRKRVDTSPRRRPRQSMWVRLALYDAAARITTGRSIIDFGKD